MKSKREQAIFLVALACSMLLMTAGCSKKDNPGAGGKTSIAAQAIKVQLASAKIEPMDQMVNVTGTLYADETATISAKVAGRITAVLKDLGDRVAPGELLATIDSTDYDLEIRQRDWAIKESLVRLGLSEMPGKDFDPSQVPTVRRAAVQEANAKSRLDRLRQLHEKKLVSDQDFFDAQTAWEVARSEHEVAILNARTLLAEVQTKQAELSIAQQRKLDTQIIAPKWSATATQGSTTTRNFVVAAKLVAQGEYVREGTSLFRLLDDHPIRLRTPLAERYLNQIKIDQPVVVKAQAYAEPFQGRVARISPEIDPGNRSFIVEISIPNTDGKLKAGGFVTASIRVQADQPAVFIPEQGMVTFAGVSKVFVIKQNKAQEIRVRPGLKREDKVQILEGLKGNEQIISPIPSRLVTGAPVQVN